MPRLEDYEVSAETIVTVKANGKMISSFKTFAEASGSSNDDKFPSGGMMMAIATAIAGASVKASHVGKIVWKDRRKELGYRDGD